MQIPEGTTENKMLSLDPYLQVTIKDGDKVYYQDYQKEFTSLYPQVNNFSHKIDFDGKSLGLDYKDYVFVQQRWWKNGINNCSS
jgi:hypothetical protein